MKTIISWYTLKQFVLVYCCATGLNLLLSLVTPAFDLSTQITPRNLLFSFLVAVFVTLLAITRHRKRQGENA